MVNVMVCELHANIFNPKKTQPYKHINAYDTFSQYT